MTTERDRTTARRRLLNLMGLEAAVVVLAAGCGDDDGSASSSSSTTTQTDGDGDGPGTGEAAAATGFDECGLIPPDELAGIVGADAMHITARRVTPKAGGGWETACTYFVEPQLGRAGVSIEIDTATDEAQHFAGFDQRQEVEELPGLGDRAEIAASTIEGLPTRMAEMRILDGTTGVHITYHFTDDPGGMPHPDEGSLAQLAATTVDRLPGQFEVTPDLAEGSCAAIDLAEPSQVLGGDLTAGRSVLGEAGAMNCDFAGESAYFGALVATDPAEVQDMRVAPEEITEPDLGDGARVTLTTEGGSPVLLATVNAGERVITVQATFDPAAGATAVEPEHLAMLTSLVDGIAA